MTTCGKILLGLYRMVVQRMVMTNELKRLIAEQAADMAGEPHGSRGDRVKGIMRSDTRCMDEQLFYGTELTARREELLANYPFRTRRERRIYELHASGTPAAEIAERMHRSKGCVLRVIWRVERSIYDGPQSPTFTDLGQLRVWQYWLHGWAPSHIARRCGVMTDYVDQVVRDAIRRWRRAPAPNPGAALWDYLTPGFDQDFIDKLGNLTPADALEVAQRHPEIAEMLQRLGLTGGHN